MSRVNHSSMTDQKLKRYVLEHRDNNEAFYVHADCSRATSRLITIASTNPNREDKLVVKMRRNNQNRTESLRVELETSTLA